MKIKANRAVLEIISPKGTVPSVLVAGIVIDTFKASIGLNANAIRAVVAQASSDRALSSALCLYLEGIESNAS